MSGHLYYDETGAIKTVTLRPLSNTPHRHLAVSEGLAVKFLRGEVRQNLYVDLRMRQPRLQCDTDIGDMSVDTGSYMFLTPINEMCNIVIQYATETNDVSFSLFGKASFTLLAKTLTFFLASKTDRTDVRSCFVLDLERMISGHTATWPLPCRWTDQLTLLHKEVSLGLVVETTRYSTTFIPINRRDMNCRIRLPRYTKNPLLICEKTPDGIMLRWGQKGGRLYDRSLSVLPFFVTRRGDPSIMIDSFEVDIDRLRQNDIKIPRVYSEEVDFYTLMYFADMLHC